MLTVNVQDATANLSDLLARAERGEEVWIARDGTPVVRLVPAERKPRQFGIMNGPDIPDSFFEPMTEGGLAAWE
ncbi:type II toxin-antitoxin system prevent-host-death family antitoxin [Cellulomonas cellasea]|uniref:type II toxin-antitoxin system Phd/YefM family antitoxin n=1 Tax=Cellulomonas cellasea TaxID=43670 RepID=UPI0025A4C235|nr:type II toxin-antitoxin system prevent-host-death family antitoxin [Cellulomonas cellasea]MDM8085275.1 type II toxin-antitoxin system prevent-host-death family antitoxin [Cellulomonas cellasea]